MRRSLACALLVAGCGPGVWIAPAPDGESSAGLAAPEGIVRAWRRAAEERERDFAEALHPGARAEARRRRLAGNDLESMRAAGEELFFLDTPWRGEAAAAVLPAHARGAATPDATRCSGCHHVGGEGGSGGYGDLALFEASGDDVLSAQRRLPRMLAGAALLERAADGRSDLQPFGWAPGRPRRLRDLVRWSIDTHLAALGGDDEVDALAIYLALLPAPSTLPPPRDSLVLRAARGAELFTSVGCAGCHAESLPVTDPVLRLSSGRRIDLSRRLSSDGRPPWSIVAYTDLRAHHMGAALRDGEAGDDVFITPPLWGVASRGPWLHDGRAATLHEAILAHGGEAARARDAYVALDTERSAVQLFLATLGRAPSLAWQR